MKKVKIIEPRKNSLVDLFIEYKDFLEDRPVDALFEIVRKSNLTLCERLSLAQSIIADCVFGLELGL